MIITIVACYHIILHATMHIVQYICEKMKLLMMMRITLQQMGTLSMCTQTYHRLLNRSLELVYEDLGVQFRLKS